MIMRTTKMITQLSPSLPLEFTYSWLVCELFGLTKTGWLVQPSHFSMHLPACSLDTWWWWFIWLTFLPSIISLMHTVVVVVVLLLMVMDLPLIQLWTGYPASYYCDPSSSPCAFCFLSLTAFSVFVVSCWWRWYPYLALPWLCHLVLWYYWLHDSSSGSTSVV